MYELRSQTLHAKSVSFILSINFGILCLHKFGILFSLQISIDGVYCSLGSFNFDMLSWRYNLEVNLTVLDPELGSKVELSGHLFVDFFKI